MLTSAEVALSFSFADLEFGDGHSERWLGPATPLPLDDRSFSAALEAAAEQMHGLIEEVRAEYQIAGIVPVPSEVVVEWNRPSPSELGPA